MYQIGGGGGVGGGVKLKEPEEDSLDYCGIAKFTQESLLICDLLKRLVLPA